MSLDFSPFANALASLEEALELYSRLADQGDALRRLARDSTIQRFEFTYELAIRFLKRMIEEIESEAEVDQLTFRDLVRLGAEKGLVREPTLWFEFRQKRNLTVHTYNEINAEAVLGVLTSFRDEARWLLARLEERQ